MKTARRFVTNWRNVLALTVPALFVVVALAAPLLAPSDTPDGTHPFRLVESLSRVPLPPDGEAMLGTAMVNRPPILLHYDVYHSLIWGTRQALVFGLVVTLSTASLGTLMGAVSGYLGGRANRALMSVTDGLLAFPVIAGVWLFRQLLTTASLGQVAPWLLLPDMALSPLQRAVMALEPDPTMLALVLFSWMPYARTINASVLQMRHTDFIQAARSLGARPGRIILRHLLPNVIAPAVVLAARDIGGMVILQAGFAFVGVSAQVTQDTMSEWSRLLLLGRHWILGAGGNPLSFWWLYVPVTLALMLFGLGWNVLGDRLNATLNPRDAH